MKKTIAAAALALSMSGLPVFAADMAPVLKPSPPAPPPEPSRFDLAFGGAVMSDYNFRGISHWIADRPSGAYAEPLAALK